MLDLLGVEAELLYDFFHDQLLPQLVHHHHSGPVYLTVLDLHLLREEVLVKTLEVVGIRLVQDLRGLVQHEDELLSGYHLLSLHFSLVAGFAGLDQQGTREEGLEVGEGELGVEHAPVEVEVQGLAVLENVGL